MAVKISRNVTLGPGTRAFRFRNEGDQSADRKHYEEGLKLENARFLTGSLAQRLFDRLSADPLSRPKKVELKKKLRENHRSQK